MKKIISLLLTVVMLLSVISVSFVATSAATTEELPFAEKATMTKIMSGFSKTSSTVYKLSNGAKTTIGKLKHSGQAPYITQGATMIGEDYYISATYKSSYEIEYGYIMKYDTSAKKMYVSELLPISHANDLCYNPDKNWILVSNNTPDGTALTIVNPDDLTLINQIKLSKVYGDTNVGFYGVEYNTRTKEYIICSSGTNTMNYILDENFNVLRSHQRKDLNLDKAKKPYYLKQGMCATPDYVMHVYAGGPIGSYVNKIVVTDWDGNYIQTVTDTIKSEIEDVFSDENGRYYAAYHNQSAGGYIYEMKMTKFTCNYDANGGEGAMADSQHSYGVSQALSANKFTKSMHTFAGWTLSRKSDCKSLYTNDGGKTSVWYKTNEQPEGYKLAVYADKQKVSALSYAINDEIYLTAQWAPYKFTVAYNKNGGTGSMSTTTAYCNQTASLSANTFTRAHYDFVGWNMYHNSSKKYLYQSQDNVTGWYKSGKQPKGWTMKVFADQADITNFSSTNNDAFTAYACWRRIKYTVQYDANGGTGTMASATFERGTNTALANNTFTRENYTFKGWVVSRASDGKTYYTKGETSGWYVPGEEPEGYKESILSNKYKVSALADVYGDVVTCTAQWEKYYYTVAYNKNGGTGSMSSTKVGYDETVALTLNTMYRTNYDFVGWEVYRGSDKKYLYEGTDGTTGWYANNKQPKGWTKVKFTDGQEISGLSTKNTDTITLYAIWRRIKYTVQYDANGGTGTMASATFERGTNTALANNTFTRENYTFKGWVVSRASDGKTYYTKGETSGWYVPGEEPEGYKESILSNKYKVSALADVYGDVVTCTAQWEKYYYTVAYNKNGGTGSMSSTKVGYDETVALTLNTIYRTNYDFVGWEVYRGNDKTYLYVGADGTTGWYKSGKQPKNWTKKLLSDGEKVCGLSLKNGDTVTLYASWRRIKYTVQYDANGGTGTMKSATFERGTSTALANNVFTRENHTFKGWVVSRESDGKTYYTNGKTSGWYVPGEEPDGYNVSVLSNKYKVTALADVHEDVVTCTAQWEKYYYTVAYNKNGGSGSMSNTKVSYDETVALSNITMTKTDYAFIGWEVYRGSDKKYLYEGTDGTTGWYTNNRQPKGWTKVKFADGQEVYGLSAKNADTITLYATWTRVTYTVEYDANGGEGTIAPSTHQRGVSKALSTNVFKRTGYIFKGWTLQRVSDNKILYIKGSISTWYAEGEQPAGYTVAVYSDKQKVSKLTEVHNDVVTCTAKWEAIKYTITYNSNGGSGKMSNTTAYYDSTVVLSEPTFENDVYFVQGWTAYRKSDSTFYYSGCYFVGDELVQGSGWYKEGQQPEGLRKVVFYGKNIDMNFTSVNGDTIVLYADWTKVN